MQAVGGGVEADIAGDRPLQRQGVQALEIGALVDVAPLVEQAQEVGAVPGHRCGPSRLFVIRMAARSGADPS